MPHITINNCQYYYEFHGEGTETLVLSHGLLWSSKMFKKQIEALESDYRILCFDHRGQGQSEVTANGYSMDQLSEDASILIEKLCQTPVHFGGLSMGGFVGLRLAARHPDMIKSLILMETTAQAEPNTIKYSFLNTVVKLFGVKIVNCCAVIK